MKTKMILGAGLAALLCGAAAFAQQQNDPLASAAGGLPGQPVTAKNGIARAEPVPGVPAYINEAVRSWARLPQDIWADPYYKPAQVTQFIGVKPGDKVVDFIPGHLYWSRLFAKTVGLKGFVYPFIPQIGCRPAHRGTCVPGEPTSTSVGYNPKDKPTQTVTGDARWNGIDEALDTQNMWDYSRNLGVIWNVAGQFSLPEQIDVVWSFGHWHNLRTWDYTVNMPPFLALMFEGIKPGGILAVADYASAPGKGFTQAESLHRVDKDAVKAEILAAGFEFVGESDLLANPSDDHTKKVDDDARYNKAADMFLLKFKKPLNAPKDRRPAKAQWGDWIGGASSGVWYNEDGTYNEYRGAETWSGRWYFDAQGNICLWNEYPAFVRGLIGCHPWHTQHFGDVFKEDTNRPQPSTTSLVKERFYPKEPPAERTQPADRTRG